MTKKPRKNARTKPEKTKPVQKAQAGVKTRKEVLLLVQEKLKTIILTESQQQYLDIIKRSTVTFCHGPAGTSKTFIACYASLDLLCKHKYERIILSKPIQEAGEHLGFLPGEIEDKIGPYMESYSNNYTKILGRELFELVEEMFIEFRPLAYMRGIDFDYSFMILDEAQNADFRQLIMFSTRMGKKGHQLICGDVSQYDIEKGKVQLPEFMKIMDGIEGIEKFIFTEKDIVRHPILIEMVKRYEKWKYEEKR